MSEPAWKALLNEASALRNAGRVGEAIAAYQRLLEANPDLPASWYNLGWLQKQARRFEDALGSYQQALDRDVGDPEEVRLNRAVILADHLGRSEEALSELEAALALNPNYVPALLNLGNLHEDRGDKAAAREAYERALALDPANALALARLAESATRLANRCWSGCELRSDAPRPMPRNKPTSASRWAASSTWPATTMAHSTPIPKPTAPTPPVTTQPSAATTGARTSNSSTG